MNGVALLPITCGLLPASVIVGVLMSKYGRFRPAVWAGWIVTVLATSLLCLLGTNTSIATYVVIFLCVGLGQGLLLSSLNFTVQAIASTQDVAYAAALYAFLRGVGLCLGVAIGGTIFQNFLSRYLAQAGLPTAIAGDAEGFIATLKSLQESKYKEDLLHAFSRAFVGLFAILSGISTLGGFVSLAVRKHGMDKPMDSEHVLQQKGTEASQSDKNTTETEG
jgi:MFS family permease